MSSSEKEVLAVFYDNLKIQKLKKCDEYKKWIYVVRGLYLFRKRWCPKTFVVDREEMSNVHPKGMVNLVFFKSKAYKINSMSWLSSFGDLQYFLALFFCFQLVSPSGFCWLLRKPHLWGHQNGWYIVYIVYRIYHIKGWVRSVTDCSKMHPWQKLYQCRCMDQPMSKGWISPLQVSCVRLRCF